MFGNYSISYLKGKNKKLQKLFLNITTYGGHYDKQARLFFINSRNIKLTFRYCRDGLFFKCIFQMRKNLQRTNCAAEQKVKHPLFLLKWTEKTRTAKFPTKNSEKYFKIFRNRKNDKITKQTDVLLAVCLHNLLGLPKSSIKTFELRSHRRQNKRAI